MGSNDPLHLLTSYMYAKYDCAYAVPFAAGQLANTVCLLNGAT